MEKNKTYLGDGVYAEYDGFQFHLYTVGYGKNQVFLEPDVVDDFLKFISKCCNIKIEITHLQDEIEEDEISQNSGV